MAVLFRAVSFLGGCGVMRCQSGDLLRHEMPNRRVAHPQEGMQDSQEVEGEIGDRGYLSP